MSRMAGVRLRRLLPCLADQAKVRAVFEFDEDLTGLLPYLNAVLPRAIYNHTERLLTFTQGGVMVTLRPQEAALARADSIEHAWRVVAGLGRLCEETEARRGEIEPSFEQRHRLRALDVLRLLPGAREGRYCRECGEPTCLVFATRLVAERINVTACRPLFEEEYAERRQVLLELLQAAGYCVPVG